jgi:hypothetical protein
MFKYIAWNDWVSVRVILNTLQLRHAILWFYFKKNVIFVIDLHFC